MVLTRTKNCRTFFHHSLIQFDCHGTISDMESSENKLRLIASSFLSPSSLKEAIKGALNPRKSDGNGHLETTAI